MGIAVKVDEDLPVAVARRLRRAGHDAVTVAEQGWSGRSDPVLWTGVQKEQRMLITADKGFADVRHLSSHPHFGVVLLRLERESWQGYVELVEKLLASTTLDLLVGALTVVTVRGIRIRRG